MLALGHLVLVMCLSKLTAAFVLASESRQKLPQDLDLPPTRTARRGLAVADLSVDASARPPRARARRIQPPENLRWALPTIKALAARRRDAQNAAPPAPRPAPSQPPVNPRPRPAPRPAKLAPAMQSPRRWPPPAPARADSPSSPTLKELKASLQLCASPKNGDDKTYSYLTAGVSTPTQPSIIDDLKASGKTLLMVTLLSPVLLILIAYHTFADMIAGTLSAIVSLLVPAKINSRGAVSPTKRRDQRPCLVFPGCGCYVFWQLGMVQFLVERYDLRGVKIVGNGSGAVCAAAILAMESGVPGYPPPAACVVRKRARAMQKQIDQKIDSVRLSQILRTLLEEHLPSSDHLSLGHDRIAVGMRTLQCRPLPCLYPSFCSQYRSREDFAQVVVAASATAPGIASWKPFRSLRKGVASDGVNALSLWSLVTYALALLCRKASAPLKAHPLSSLVAAWNFPVLNLIFARSSTCPARVWVAPTPSLLLHRFVAPSRAQAASLWSRGYEEGRRLDAKGAFGELECPRRAVA